MDSNERTKNFFVVLKLKNNIVHSVATFRSIMMKVNGTDKETWRNIHLKSINVS